jgi:hypothetical protein
MTVYDNLEDPATVLGMKSFRETRTQLADTASEVSQSATAFADTMRSATAVLTIVSVVAVAALAVAVLALLTVRGYDHD